MTGNWDVTEKNLVESQVEESMRQYRVRRWNPHPFTTYCAVPNKRTVWNNRAGYYIGLFGHYIKNHVLFNKFFWKKSKNNNRACTLIRDCRVPGIIKFSIYGLSQVRRIQLRYTYYNIIMFLPPFFGTFAYHWRNTKST